MTNAALLRRVEKLIEAARNSAITSQARSQIDSITISTAYAEPGYADPTSGVVCFGNWNSISKYDGNKFVTVDDAPARLAKLLERLAVELEWSDEWACCDHCRKAVRTQADSYSWRPSYASTDDGIICHECIEADPTDYLQSLEGDSHRCVTFDIDLEAQGYKLLSEDYQNGLYGGQSASPGLIADELRQQEIDRFIFRLDASRQFDMSFSVWVHEDEYDLIDMEQFETAPTDGLDPAVQMQKALADASSKMATIEGGIRVAKCDVGTGLARVRTVTPEEFVAGTALDF